MNAIHPQYVTDQEGRRVSVLLPVDELEALLEDVRDALEAHDEPTESWESVNFALYGSRTAPRPATATAGCGFWSTPS